ncbi:hypothetical protein GCK32_015905, partial [Trichostrongylus colubriformis]
VSGSMTVIVIRAITLATLVHLSQISPALSCTLTEVPNPAAVRCSSRSFWIELEDCLRLCLEKPMCNLIRYNQPTCMFYENAERMGTDWHRANTQPEDLFFVVDHSSSNTSCPTVEEWIKSDSYNH